ncbi:Hypothetical protein D9617_1g080530 [Elsinoe fawcettii]|nr:Hypothetical protein D9617_1g080530 [Elsinoe fawcettii]
MACLWALHGPHSATVTTWIEQAKTEGLKAVAPQSLETNKAGDLYNDDLYQLEAHPVKALYDAAVQRYQDMLNRQSTSLNEATEEYIRRYRRKPPPGFDDWYKFAKEKGSLIIDDFDIIEKNLEPFWRMDPKMLRGMVEHLAGDHMKGGRDLWSFTVKNGNASASEGNWRGLELMTLLQSVWPNIPDLSIFMNPLDEPRIVASSDSTITSYDDVSWKTLTHTSIWKEATAFCNTTKRSILPSTVDKHGLPFVTDPQAEMDVCMNPSLATSHGFYIAPSTMIMSNSPIPILSQAAGSSFTDILFPSLAYYNEKFLYRPKFDLDWVTKLPKLYWAGSSTGGWNGPPVDESTPSTEAQRHRLISLTHHLSPSRVYKYLTRSRRSQAWTRYESDEPLSTLYHTQMTAAVQCDPSTCNFIHKYYGIGPKEDADKALRFKFQMDVDGNSFSGRFYRILASKSCVLKMTVFKEWHDERLVPWLHYVPISNSMDELPETMRYLALTDDGDGIAHSIADAGRDAYLRTLRKEDIIIYLYRLFLEYAREPLTYLNSRQHPLGHPSNPIVVPYTTLVPLDIAAHPMPDPVPGSILSIWDVLDERVINGRNYLWVIGEEYAPSEEELAVQASETSQLFQKGTDMDLDAEVSMSIRDDEVSPYLEDLWIFGRDLPNDMPEERDSTPFGDWVPETWVPEAARAKWLDKLAGKQFVSVDDLLS